MTTSFLIGKVHPTKMGLLLNCSPTGGTQCCDQGTPSPKFQVHVLAAKQRAQTQSPTSGIRWEGSKQVCRACCGMEPNCPSSLSRHLPQLSGVRAAGGSGPSPLLELRSSQVVPWSWGQPAAGGQSMRGAKGGQTASSPCLK